MAQPGNPRGDIHRSLARPYGSPGATLRSDLIAAHESLMMTMVYVLITANLCRTLAFSLYLTVSAETGKFTVRTHLSIN